MADIKTATRIDKFAFQPQFGTRLLKQKLHSAMTQIYSLLSTLKKDIGEPAEKTSSGPQEVSIKKISETQAPLIESDKENLIEHKQENQGSLFDEAELPTPPDAQAQSSWQLEQAGRHLRAAEKLVEVREALDKQGAAYNRQDLGFLPRGMVEPWLPYQEPSKELSSWSKSKRPGGIILRQGVYTDDFGNQQSMGFPYGIYPRLLLYWIVTQAKVTKRRDLAFDMSDYGTPLADYIFNKYRGLTHGAGGTFGKLKEQIQRLFALNISASDDPHAPDWRFQQMTLVDEASINTIRTARTQELFSVKFVLSERFFEKIMGTVVPLDLGILANLGRSPMAMDIYPWLSRHVYNINSMRHQSLRVSWLEIESLFGTPGALRHKTRENFKQNLATVEALWPGLAAGLTLNTQGLEIGTGIPLTVGITKALRNTG